MENIGVLPTLIALRGPAHEANPIMAKIMDTIGVVPALLITKGAVIALLWYYQALLPVELLWALCAFYVWIVWGNVQTIRK